MVKVSVIIPCLNMKNFISECVRSVMQQTLKELEIIVVDAGSLDGTLSILDMLKNEDSRIRIIHSEKKSYGYQVNLGIVQTTGLFIAIVDADDRITPNMYEVLYENAILSDADYVKGAAKAFYTLDDKRVYYIPMMQLSQEEYVDGRSFLVPMERPDLLTKDNFLWYGIYRKEFMKSIRLHESLGAAFQDLGGLLQTQMNAKNALYLNEAFYEYRQDNIASSSYNRRGFEFVWNEYVWAEHLVINAPQKWKTAFYKKLFLHTLDRHYAMSASGNFWDSADDYINLIRKKIKLAISDKILTENDFKEEEKENFKIFIEDELGLFNKYVQIYREKRRQINNVLKITRRKETVIFGCGKYGIFVHALMLKQGLGNIVAYCDNAVAVLKREVWDVPILLPKEAVRFYPNAFFLIANRVCSDEMEKELINLGIPKERICCYTAGVDARFLGDEFL